MQDLLTGLPILKLSGDVFDANTPAMRRGRLLRLVGAVQLH
jgi:hypothetical protein